MASSLFVVSVGAAERVADHLASGPKTPDQLAAAKRPIRGHRRKPRVGAVRMSGVVFSPRV